MQSSFRTRTFKETLESLSYVCVNAEPTFFHRTGCSLLDLILTDSPEIVTKQDQLSMSGVSNHDMVFCSIRVFQENRNSIVTYRDYLNFDSTLLQEAFLSIDWNFFFAQTDPNELLHFMNYHLLLLHDNHIPIRRKRNNANPWFSNAICCAIVDRDFAYRTWKHSKSEIDRNTYKRLRNRVNTMISQAKIECDRLKFNTDLPSKQLWRNIKKLGVTKECSFANEDFAANEINDYFTSNFTVDPSSEPVPSTVQGFNFVQVVEHDIVNCVFFNQIKCSGH